MELNREGFLHVASDIDIGDSIHDLISDVIECLTPAARQKGLTLHAQSPSPFDVALSVYLKQLVYDGEKKVRLPLHVHLQSHPSSQLTARGNIVVKNAEGIIIADEVLAKGEVCPIRLVGRESDQTGVYEPPLSIEENLAHGASYLKSLFNVAIDDPEARLPTRLKAEMVKGSTLPEETIDIWTREMMTRFLNCRGWKRKSSGSGPATSISIFSENTIHDGELRQACRNIIEREKSRPVSILPDILSPEKWSLRDFYRKAGIPLDYFGYRIADIPAPVRQNISLSDLEELSVSTISSKVGSDWIPHKDNPEALLRIIPKFSSKTDIIEKHMTWSSANSREPERFNKLGCTKGWKMFCEWGSVLGRLKAYRRPVDPAVDNILPIGDDDDRSILFATTDVPPSMKTDEKYTTSVALLVEPLDDGPSKATRVTQAECTCRSGLARRCSHVAALLYMLEQYHFIMEPGTNKPKNLTWWKPRPNDSFLVNVPLSHIPFRNPDRKKDLQERDGIQNLSRKRRKINLHGEDDGRYDPLKWNGIVQKFNRPFNDPGFQGKLLAFFTSVRGVENTGHDIDQANGPDTITDSYTQFDLSEKYGL
jgi:hypothetical protein